MSPDQHRHQLDTTFVSAACDGRMMESIQELGYLQYNPDTMEQVRRDINLHRPGEMQDAVRILDEWVHQQRHFLLKDIPLPFLETTIVMSKGSIERSKTLLDRMCTLRTLLPKYFVTYDIKDFEILKGSSYMFFTPRLTEENRRVFVIKYIGKYGEPLIVENIYRFLFSLFDYVKLFDYHSGVEVVYDISEIDIVDALANVDLFEVKNVYISLLETYGIRVKSVHLITASKLVDTVISFFKQFLKKKLMDRVVVHKSIEELHKFYPRDLLPKEYGGTGKSLHELQDDCLNLFTLEEYKKNAKILSGAKVDEKLRPASQFNDLYAGTYGTIRSLTVD